jgi:hypothetical protein
MNKQFIYLTLFYFLSQNVIAQNTWLKNFGSTQFDNTDKVSTDDLNNVYISGRMRTLFKSSVLTLSVLSN